MFRDPRRRDRIDQRPPLPRAVALQHQDALVHQLMTWRIPRSREHLDPADHAAVAQAGGSSLILPAAAQSPIRALPITYYPRKRAAAFSFSGSCRTFWPG